MSNDFEKIYVSTLNQLDDLKFFVDEKDEKSIEQLTFFVEELFEKHNHIEGIYKFSNVYAVLKDKVSSYLKNILLKNQYVHSINFQCVAPKIELADWNKILELGNYLKQIVFALKFVDCLNIRLRAGHLEVYGNINKRLLEDSCQDISFGVTRSLLEKKVLLTYYIVESSESNNNNLLIDFDFSHSNHMFYSVEIDKERELVLNFSNISTNYQMSEVNHKLKKHLCIEIKKDLSFQSLSKIPDDFSKTILYFPFLFRPISIIIPKRGKLISSLDFPSLKNDDNFHYIDFFSIFGQH